jgi:hypothetical protein
LRHTPTQAPNRSSNRRLNGKGLSTRVRIAIQIAVQFRAQFLRKHNRDPIIFLFESYGFIHGCIIINDKELVIRNDSMGGHIHIIASLVTTHGFLCRRHFLANVLRVIGTELWFC